MTKRETMTERLRRMNAEQQTAASEPAAAESQLSESSLSDVSLTDISLPDSSVSDISISENRTSDIHPAAGGRGDFLKVTVTMDPDDFEAINAEMVRRKRAKEKGAQLSGCIREAIRFWRAAGMPRQE